MPQTQRDGTTRSPGRNPQARRHRPGHLRVLVGVPAAALASLAVAAGCGGGGGSGGTSGYNQSSPPTQAASAGTIKAASVANLGNILVDGEGRTVYMFEKDTGNKSSCSGACASVWPPVTTSAAPRPGSGVTAAKLSTTKRSDGTMEVSYAGHPLYYYAPDGTSGGQAGGQGLDQFGAKWYVMSPSGNAVTK